jgi:hypothetical protein
MTQLSTVADEKELANVSAKPAELYKDVPLTSLTAYSLYWLHKWKLPRTIEAVTVLNWKLFPKKFSMVSFPEYPDAFRTNRSLLQMQPKYRNLLTGAAVKGFSLNERGMEIAQDLNSKFGAPKSGTGDPLGDIREDVQTRNRFSQARTLEPEREMSRVKASKLFDKWKNGLMTDRDLIHVHALLGIFNHTPATVRVRAMKSLEKSAAKVGDEEILHFLDEIRKTFPMILVR